MFNIISVLDGEGWRDWLLLTWAARFWYCQHQRRNSSILLLNAFSLLADIVLSMSGEATELLPPSSASCYEWLRCWNHQKFLALTSKHISWKVISSLGS